MKSIRLPLIQFFLIIQVGLYSQFSIKLNEKTLNFCYQAKEYSLDTVSSLFSFKHTFQTVPSRINKHSDTIGASIIVNNGMHPYKFSWKCKDILNRNASYFLEDTSSPITKFKKDIEYNVDSIVFYLEVYDSLNQYSFDSTIVKISRFAYIPYYESGIEICDSAKICQSYKVNYPPIINTEWNIKELNNEKECTYVKNGGTYISSVTDRYQCSTGFVSGAGYFKMPCRNISIQNTEKVELFKDFINPIKSNSKIHFKDSSKYYNFYCYSLLGKILYNKKVNNYIDFEKMNLSKGIYYIVLDEYKPIKILVE